MTVPMGPTVVDTRTVERGIASLVEAFRRIARLSEHGASEERDGVVCVATGMPLPPFNPAFVVRPPRDPATTFRWVLDFYGRRGLTGEIIAWTDTAHAIADAATGAGLTAGHRIPCLLLAPLASAPPTAPDLQVRRVADTASLLRFNDVCAEGFGLERQVIAAFDDPRLLELPGAGLHLGFVDGAAVATSLSYGIDDVVLVFNVTTLESHRRRGIGEAMTWRALQEGLTQGCDVAFLQSSAAGRPVYERMGFRHAVDMQTWSWP
jgi:GNAT superfamily N-acetyltransferase